MEVHVKSMSVLSFYSGNPFRNPFDEAHNLPLGVVSENTCTLGVYGILG